MHYTLKPWPLAAENFARIRQSAAEGHYIELGAAPSGWKLSKLFANHRRASITARTDAKSIAARPCFLCKANRPAEQTSELWRGYEVLLNPFPLSERHLTIASLRHEPQAITPARIADMAALARDLEGMCVFYNGPRCGASAPDHFHFQAIGPDRCRNILHLSLPAEPVCRRDGAMLYAATDAAPYPLFIIESTADSALSSLFATLSEALSGSIPGETEPMMNIVMLLLPDGRTLRTVIIPRGKHRPACYTAAESPMLVSPATVEMLGTIVCSRKEDFDRIDSRTASEILSEVGLPLSTFNLIVNRLRDCPNPHYSDNL